MRAHQNEGEKYRWIWRYLSEMPPGGRDAESWVRAIATAYGLTTDGEPSGPRLTETIYRSWQNVRRAEQEQECAEIARQYRERVVQPYQAEFQRMLRDDADEQSRIARELLSEFRTIPNEHPTAADLEFWMGSPEDEPWRHDDERLHLTSIPGPYQNAVKREWDGEFYEV